MTAGELRKEFNRNTQTLRTWAMCLKWFTYAFLGAIAIGADAVSTMPMYGVIGIPCVIVSTFVSMFILEQKRQKISSLYNNLATLYKARWRALMWTPENFVPRLKELLPSNDLGATVEFAKLLVWDRGMGPYTSQDIYETVNNPRHVAHFVRLRIINLFSSGSLRWTPEGLVWSDDICEKFFRHHPVPDDFDPNPPVISGKLTFL